MPFTKVDSINFERQTIRKRFCWKHIETCCIDGDLSWFKPTRRCYLRWRPWLKVLCLLILYSCVFGFILSRNLQNTRNFPSPNIIFHRFSNVQAPQYLLLDIDDNSQPKCKPIFESSMPHNLRHNATDKELVNSLFGKKINLAYVIQSDSNERVSIMRGKLCSNSSNEWMLLTIFEKGSEEKSIGESVQAIEAWLDGSREAHECVSFDFEKCSLNNLQNDYPKLFQLDHQQQIKRGGTSRGSLYYVETIHTVYYYIRRKAADFIRYKRQLTKIDYASLNMTMVPDLITSQEIRIRVKLSQTSTLFTNMDCVATLRKNGSNQICSLQMVNATIQFDRLSSSTNYDICINCEGINEICKQIKTSPKILSFDYQSYTSSSFSSDTPSIISAYSALFIIIILVLILIILFLSKLNTIASSCRRLFTRSSMSSTDGHNNQTSYSYTNIRNNTNTVPVRRPEHNRSEAADNVSIPKNDGIIVRELRSSTSSINSTYLIP